MATPKLAPSEKTKAVILEQALILFRERGFEATTMRDIARAADVALGATYYYFESKESIVAAYYDQVQQKHQEVVLPQLSGKDLRQRLALVLHSKLDIVKDDRKFLGALFRYTGEPGHPLSVLGKGTQSQRSQSIALFRSALAGADVPEDFRPVLPWGLWLAHLGIILAFIHDKSPEQARTHALVDGFADLVSQILKLAGSAFIRPFVQPFQTKLIAMLHDTGWLES